MKIVVFGVGGHYQNYKKYISVKDKIVAYIDNNYVLWDTYIDNVKVYSPLKIRQFCYDKVIIMSSYVIEIKNQLLEIGIESDKIWHYEEYIAWQKKDEIKKFGELSQERNFLIITTSFGYHGGALVAVYAAMALQNIGFQVTLAAPEGDIHFINEFIKYHIQFEIHPNLKYAKNNTLSWTKKYDWILVNTYPMIKTAIEISKGRKVFLWLHEVNEIYPIMDFWLDDIRDGIDNKNLKIYAVSNVAKQNFINYVRKKEIEILCYGIPDKGYNYRKFSDINFAIVGNIQPRKQQYLFLEAIQKLKSVNNLKNKFYLIGKIEETDYAKTIISLAKCIPKVIITGELQRLELDKLYDKIDIFVIPSKEETMSLIATEAMMKGKICIICDVAGMADYIKHGENGFLFKTNDMNDLVQQMKFCLDNQEILYKIGRNARETYLENFTIGNLEENLQKLLII